MKNLTLTLLAAAAVGVISLGSASAMPFGSPSPALGKSDVENVRVVCDQYGRCYNTRRTYRSTQRYYAPGYYNGGYYNNGYYGGPRYGYYGRPHVGVGIGPLQFGLF